VPLAAEHHMTGGMTKQSTVAKPMAEAIANSLIAQKMRLLPATLRSRSQ